MSKIKDLMKYQCIFVDCWDTLIHRREHPYQVIERWAECVHRLYPSIETKRILADRFRMTSVVKIDEIGIKALYQLLADIYWEEGLITDKDSFQDDAIKLELWCEISISYRDESLYKKLEKVHRGGIPIYCITDFHFQAEDILFILEKMGIYFLSGVYSSASMGATKRDGQLYLLVLHSLNVVPERCVMIGDDIKADIKSAKSNRLRTKYISHSLHKNILRVSNRIGVNPVRNTISTIGKEIWKQGNRYEEFIVLFYVFTERLYKEGKRRGLQKIVFLAREGYYLKKIFDDYQRMRVPKTEQIETAYLRISRRSIGSVQADKCRIDSFSSISVRNYFKSIGYSSNEVDNLAKLLTIDDIDKVITNFPDSEEARKIKENDRIQKMNKERFDENSDAFHKIISSLIDNNRLCIVDVGWQGSMQQGIACLYPEIDVVGFYIGILANLQSEPQINRSGLIFFKDEDSDYQSNYYDILRANTQLDEQLLAAPHGSALYYALDKAGEAYCVEEWDEDEKNLYNEVIDSVQNKMDNLFLGICTRLNELDNNIDQELAACMLRSALIQSKQRMNFMKRCTQGFVWNFRQENKNMNYDTSKVKLPILDVITHPVRYVRFMAKAGIVMDKKGLGFVGRTLMGIYYGYTKLLCRL